MPVIQFIGKETVHAAHVTNRRDQDIQKDRRKWPPRRHAGVSFENLFVVEIHVTSSWKVYQVWPRITRIRTGRL